MRTAWASSLKPLGACLLAVMLCAGLALPAHALTSNTRFTSAVPVTKETAYRGVFEGGAEAHTGLFCHDNPVMGRDPSGHAAYFVERKLSMSGGTAAYYLGNSGHGYLLFTPTSDPGSGDPFVNGQPAVATFSWHPNIWDYQFEELGKPGVPGRVWEDHPDDIGPTWGYQTFLVTADSAQQQTLLTCIRNWIRAMNVGYDYGNPRPDDVTPDLNNEIGVIQHIPAPANGVYYSLTGQNCVWWATIMLKQSGIRVLPGVYDAISHYEHGIGAGPQVISGQRSPYECGRTPTNPFGIVPTVNDYIDSSAFGAANFGFL